MNLFALPSPPSLIGLLLFAAMIVVVINMIGYRGK